MANSATKYEDLAKATSQLAEVGPVRVGDISTTLDPELFLPDPQPRPIAATVISVDDHLIEAPDTFEGRLPKRMQDEAPRAVELEDGSHVWQFQGERIYEVGLSAVSGRRPETMEYEPTRFDQMRRGCWNADARVKDLDINGVWATLMFPSRVAGFAGTVFARCQDRELGLACIRAWNDWFYDDWYSPYPERFIPMGLTYIADPEKGAEEIRRNAARGFTAVSLPERPHLIGYPSLFQEDYWDPIVEACADTGTVINLHIGSSGFAVDTPGAPNGTIASSVGFQAYSMFACADWLWSKYPREYPDLQIVMSEGGIGWVASMMDRVDHIIGTAASVVKGGDRLKGGHPVDILRRNFNFCALTDRFTLNTRDVIGVENIMFEVDYPHNDSTWPDTQTFLKEHWVGKMSDDDLRAICSGNAARLYRHPLPPHVAP